MGERKVRGFRVDRTITVEGPFSLHDKMVATYAHAIVETQGTEYPVFVLISDQDELGFLGSGEDGRPTKEEREEARSRFALVELAQRPTPDFERADPKTLPEMRVSVPLGPDSGPRYRGMWKIQSIRKYAEEHLRGYSVSKSGNTWSATTQ